LRLVHRHLQNRPHRADVDRPVLLCPLTTLQPGSVTCGKTSFQVVAF
jgi:hypothetical protein